MRKQIRILQGPKLTKLKKYKYVDYDFQESYFEIPEIIERANAFIIALYNINALNEVVFKVRVISQTIEFLIEYSSCFEENINSILEKHFPAIRISNIDNTPNGFKNNIELYGIPDVRNFIDKEETLWDVILRNVSLYDFEVDITLHKIEQNNLLESIKRFQKIIKSVSPRTEAQKGKFAGMGRARTEIDQEARFAVEFFKTHLRRLIDGNVSGLWNTKIKISSDEKENCDNIASLFSSLTSPRDEYLYPVSSIKKDPLERISYKGSLAVKKGIFSDVEKGKEEYSQTLSSCITSFEAASIIAFPQNEIPGFKVKQPVMFGGAMAEQKEGRNISLGNLVLFKETAVKEQIPINNFVKHCLIVGTTGMGKTLTAKHILSQIHQEKIPFLIIEPAKLEYRSIKQFLSSIYTVGCESPVGKENKSPMRINPFDFPSELGVQTHIDLLKSVFNASFPMYGPMPYILEVAINNIYKKMGWDLKSGKNVYIMELEKKNMDDEFKKSDFYPTLQDLHEEIESVMQKTEYSQDLTSDIKGALRVRIGSLMEGAKGYLFNVRKSKPTIEELLSKSTLLELQYLGDDEEKTFFIGLILARIYEHYLAKNEFPGKLKHITLIEEAHRLLKNQPDNVSMELANVKAKALETFNNILAETRGYGEGLIIAEQIPTKLSPDTIKNTSMKIIHRLYSKDDREIIGDSIGLNDEQKTELIYLEPGEAVVFHEGINQPLRVKIENREDLKPTSVEDNSIKSLQIAEPYIAFLIENRDFITLIHKIINTFFVEENLKEAGLTLIRQERDKTLEYVLKSLGLKVTDDNLRNTIIQEATTRVVNHYLKEIESKIEKGFIAKLRLQKIVQECLLLVMVHNGELSKDNTLNAIKRLQENYFEIFLNSNKPYKSCKNCQKSCVYLPLIDNILNNKLTANDLIYETNERARKGYILPGDTQLDDMAKMLRDKDILIFQDIISFQTSKNLIICIFANQYKDNKDEIDKLIGIIELPEEQIDIIQNRENGSDDECLEEVKEAKHCFQEMLESINNIANKTKLNNISLINRKLSWVLLLISMILAFLLWSKYCG